MAANAQQVSPRVFNKLQSFTQGDNKALETPGLVDVLAQYVLDLYHSGEMGSALILLEQLGAISLSEELAQREKSLIVLSLVAEKVLEEDNDDLLEAIAHMLMRWLKRETEFNGGFEYICLQISKLLQRMLELSLWYQAEALVIDLGEISRVDVKKNHLLSRVIKRVQANLAQNNLLNTLIATYLDKTNDKSEIAGTLLLHLGHKSTSQMLGTLSTCEDREQRFRLLNLIPEAGDDAVPSLLEELANTSSWYYARNIIHLITKIGDPNLFAYVEPFMEHKDIRVQQEVVACARKINSDGLLKALKVCDDRLKPNIVRLLGALQDDRVSNALLSLLENYTVISKDMQDRIVREICNVIHLFPGRRAEKAVEALLDDHKEFKHFSDTTHKTLEYAFVALKNNILPMDSDSDIPEISIGPDSGVIPIVENTNFTSTGRASGDTTPQWLTACLQGDSCTAALKTHLQQRKSFYSLLTHDEFIAFSTLLNSTSYPAGSRLTTAGDIHSQLFFIEQGEVFVEFAGDKEVFVSPLQNGDIFGYDVFMSGSEWSVSLQASNEVEAIVFDQEQLLSLQPTYPLLCQKILEYAKSRDVLLRLYTATKNESLCYADGPNVSINGEIGDQISEVSILGQFSQGISFCFQLPANMTSDLLIGRDMTLFFDKEPAKPIQVSASVAGYTFSPSRQRRFCILARFMEETDITGYTCSHISL